MLVKKQYLEPDVKKWTVSNLGKEYIKAVYYHSAFLTSVQSTSCEVPGWMNQKAGIKIAKRNINFYQGLMLNLKLHYFGHLMQRAVSLEKILVLGKIEGKSRRGR